MSAPPPGQPSEPPPGHPASPVEVWRISLDLDPAERDRLASTLSAAEQDRAHSFRFATHRERFIAAHGALREILGGCLGRRPADVELTVPDGGKPHIQSARGVPDLRFSLSHSHGLALVAVAIGREVGVDVEKVDERTRVLSIARRYFAPEETAVLEALRSAARTGEFFRYWTLKEAYLKALGIGLREPLASFAVSAPEQGPPRLLWSTRGDAADWTLVSLAPAERYAAALAVEGVIARPTIHDWTPKGGS